MSTELKPEVTNQDPQSQTPESPIVQPTNISPPPVNQELLDLQLKVIADKERENRELRERLNNVQQVPPAAPRVTDEERDKDFFKNPTKAIRAILDESVAPLQGYVGELKARDGLAELKESFKNDPRYASRWSKIEPVVDEMLRRHISGGGNVNTSIMNEAVVTAIGLIASNQISGITFDNPAPPTPPTPTPAPMVNPPHLAPSTPPQPRPPEKGKVRELTENEKLLARARGWTAEQYLEGLGEAEKGAPLVITEYGQRNKKGGK